MHDRIPQVVTESRIDSGPKNGQWAALLLDINGQIENCCPHLLKQLGCNIQHLRGQPVQRLLPNIPIRCQTPGYNRAYTSFWENRRGMRQLVTSPDSGEMIDVETRLCSIPPQNVTERTMILVSLRFPNGMTNGNNDLERLEKQAENSSKAIMITDQTGLITYVNPVFEQMTGFTQIEAAGKPASLIKSGLHEDSFYTQLWNTLIDGKEFQAVFANRRKSGEIFFEEKRIRPFVDHNDESKYFVAVSHPVDSLLQGTLLRLERLANHDPLTGLPNRNLFLDRLQQHFSRASRHGTGFALAYLDLDDFKEINDTYGHAVGDQVLQATAQHIQHALRDEDTVGRLGGDEFGIILSDTDGERNVKLIIDKVQEALARGVLYNGRKIHISVSIGVIRYPEGGNDPERMMKAADSIMYLCKHAGGDGCRIFSSDEKRLEINESLNALPLFAHLDENQATSNLEKEI